MYRKIRDTIPCDNDFPYRTYMIDVYERIKNGTFYDNLKYPFSQELNDANTETISIFDRRPSVRYRLAKLVVDDTVSLLFGEGRFPSFECQDEDFRQKLEDISKNLNLKELMLTAATIGSCGSVAIFLKIINGKYSFLAKSTKYLTPVFANDDPFRIVLMTEKYKVDAESLIDEGYEGINSGEHKEYWIERVWDENQEIRFLPYPVKTTEEAEKVVDSDRSCVHGLGFVPIVWIKNLNEGNEISDVDGSCTFEPAIENIIEIDYQLSQSGRGLRYSSDPTLVIKDPSFDENGTIKKTPTRALMLGKEGEAKYVEISGNAAKAVLEYVEYVRQLAIENVHGNRANPDKLSTAQSGKAIELLHQPMIWLTDRLRVSYGKGLLELINMIRNASIKYPIDLLQNSYLSDKSSVIDKINVKEIVTLRWPSWFGKTTGDKLQTSSSLKTLIDAGLISQDTAVKSIASDYFITDVDEEISKIKQDKKELAELMSPTLAETQNI